MMGAANQRQGQGSHAGEDRRFTKIAPILIPDDEARLPLETLRSSATRPSNWLVAGALLIHASLVCWISLATSLNRTEVGHVGAAAYQWETMRFDVFHSNPPLSRLATGPALGIASPELDWTSYSPYARDRCEWEIGSAFVESLSHQELRTRIFVARCSLVPVLLLGGYFGFRLSRDVFGASAGYLFLWLWCFSPLFLAWGATVCPDAMATALGVVAAYTYRRWLATPGWTQAALGGVCLGVLPLAKLTWVIAFAVWPIIWLLWNLPTHRPGIDPRASPRPSFLQLTVVLLVAVNTLNFGYLFEGTCRPLGKFVFVSQALNGNDALNTQQAPRAGNRFADTWLGRIPVPLPAEFVQGIDTQRSDFERGFPSYMRGQWADHGWPLYYLYALAIKMPLGTWCLILLAVIVTFSGREYNATWRDEMLILVPGLAVLVCVSSQTGFSVHSRYVIPSLPFFLVWASKVGRVFQMLPLTPKRKALAMAVALAATWSTASSLWIYPHCLSYFNESVGGPRDGGAHLLGSNIDWGQDLFYLKDWLDRHPNVELDRMAYLGSYSPTRAGIPPTKRLPSRPSRDRPRRNPAAEPFVLAPGWYVVSVNEIYSRSRQYRYFLQYEPTAMAGYSIYIYHIAP